MFRNEEPFRGNFLSNTFHPYPREQSSFLFILNLISSKTFPDFLSLLNSNLHAHFYKNSKKKSNMKTNEIKKIF